MNSDVVGSARRRCGIACGWIVVFVATLLAATPSGHCLGAIVFGQLDNFQDGSLMGWDEGFSSTNPPQNVPGGGRRGAGDRFLQNVSSGGIGAGSKQVMFNQSQWTGDYATAGVTRISGWAANQGATTLHLRVALMTSSSQFASTRAIDLPADGAWRPVSFDLTDSALTRLVGTQTIAQALSTVTELRLLSAPTPDFRGEAVAGTLAVDDLRAMRPEGDANFDGAVNTADLSVVRANLGTAAGATWARGDFNFDGRVNALDLALLRRNFSTAAPAAFTASVLVPEPAAGCAALLVLATLLSRRQRRPHPVR